MDSPYRGDVTRKMFPFDDIMLLCVFTLGTETFSGYVRHRNEQCHLSHDRELIFVTSVKNVPKCLTLSTLGTHLVVFIFGTACQIYCYGRYCVRRSVSPQVPENPSGPLVDNFIVLPCVAFGVASVKLLPGMDRWNSLDDPRVIGPCHCEVWGWPRH